MSRDDLLHLHKYQGLGNDFLVAIDPDGAAALDAALARALCHRHLGVGADGLIHATRARGEGAAFTFRLWNADGSEAEMSGNGLRCLVHALADAGHLPGWASAPGPQDVTVATPAGDRPETLRPTGDPAVAWGSVGMGVVTVSGDDERCNVGHGQLRVDVGNPHLVVLGPHPDRVDVASLGSALDAGTRGGVNVEFVTLGPGPDEVTMRVWERGVGETEACGTGSCAAAAALHHWGRVGTRVTVHQPGGAAEVDLADGGDGASMTATLSGPSRRVAEISVRRADLGAVPAGVAAR
jgi:diaminopimelate epimerase